MKASTLFALIFLATSVLGQNIDPRPVPWYLHSVKVDDELYLLPEDGNPEFPANFEYINEDPILHTFICNDILSTYSDFDDTSFVVVETVATLNGCPDFPGYDVLEQKYLELFFGFEGQTFTYIAEPNPQFPNYKQLTITNPNGNEAYYHNGVLNTSDRVSVKQLIYPNPVRDRINIVNSDGSLSHLLITDSSGKIVMKKRLKAGPEWINLSALPSGIFILRLFTSAGLVGSQKIIKD